MHSRALEETLEIFARDAAQALAERLATAGELPFELESSGGRRRGGPSLYSYTPLIGRFITENWSCLVRLDSHARALAALATFDGLDRYLAAHEVPPARRTSHLHTRATEGLRAFVEDVFHDQSDFGLRQERLQSALRRVALAASMRPGALSMIATVHGMAVVSAEVPIADGLRLARPEALAGLPEQALWAKPFPVARSSPEARHLIAALTLSDEDGFDAAIEQGRGLVRDLLRTLRLFGDGRIALGPLAWVSCEDGVFQPVALALPGQPRGMLVIRPDDEEELRALWGLLKRRPRCGDSIAWALQRYEMGCERMREEEALSDHVLALQALLDPARGSDGLLAGRVAALCAKPEDRRATAERLMHALSLERALIDGGVMLDRAGLERARELAQFLAALLRDVVCGHLPADLVTLADELLLTEDPPPEPAQPDGAISASRLRSYAPIDDAQADPELQTVRARDVRRIRASKQERDELIDRTLQA